MGLFCMQNKDLEVLNDVNDLSDGEIGSESPLKIEKKCAHQSFTYALEEELVSNKKQVVQFVNDTPILIPPIAYCIRCNTSNF
ncbi:hypothetical protein H5410_061427, partial [Solanum commersonii]